MPRQSISRMPSSAMSSSVYATCFSRRVINSAGFGGGVSSKRCERPTSRLS
jgi:hypothetical protein